MICYTLSDCVLKNMDKEDEIIHDIVMILLIKNNPHKLVVDKTGKIIEIYKEAIKDNLAVFHLLQIIGDALHKKLVSIEVNDMETTAPKEEIFLSVCSQTADKILIVYDHNGWTRDKYYPKRVILHNKITPIKVLDREEAIKLLSLTDDKEARKEIATYEKELSAALKNKENKKKPTNNNGANYDKM